MMIKVFNGFFTHKEELENEVNSFTEDVKIDVEKIVTHFHDGNIIVIVIYDYC